MGSDKREMRLSAVSQNQDILQQLFILDLRHVLDIILSYLDLPTLSAVEMVSPLWAWLVHSSSSIYRNKVNCILQLLHIPITSRELASLRCPGPRSFYQHPHDCDSLHSNA